MTQPNAAKKESRFENSDVLVVHQGTKIVLPNDPLEMTREEAVIALQRAIKQDETAINVYEVVPVFPLEGAYALHQVLATMFGWVDAVPTPGFWGPSPPTTVQVEIGYGKSAQVVWGSFKVPGIDEGRLETQATMQDGRPVFVLGGEIRRKSEKLVKRIADAVRVYVREHSIYKGKAIRLNSNDNGGIDYKANPKFLDTSKTDRGSLIFSELVREQIETNLFTPITKTITCRKHGVPLKRGILLEGPYGTGKTLTANVAALLCEQNGWTFIYLDKVSALGGGLIFAQQYAPAVIFAEDIDRSLDGERDEDVDEILNQIDGVDSKKHEIITVLTTNHVEKIQKAMLRPGRLDAVISVQPPDRAAVEKLLRLYAGALIPPNAKLDLAPGELDGQIPAVIREVVERSKLYAISRLADGEHFLLLDEDLTAAARGMKAHLELLQERKEQEVSAATALGEAFEAVVEGFVDTVAIAETLEKVNYIASKVRN